MPTTTYVKETLLHGVTAHDVWTWHSLPGAFERLAPPWQEIDVEDPGDGVADGSRTLLHLKKAGLTLRWLAEHRNVEPPHGFDDVQISGPFRVWEHKHHFLEHPEGCLLRDEIRYALPLGAIGHLLGSRSVAADLDRLFRYRHEVTAQDLRFHACFGQERPLCVAVTGASGLIGSALCAFLTTGGHRVIRLVRRVATAANEVQWDPSSGIADLDRLEGLDAVVHLAGENIAGRWTKRRKQHIRDSRVCGTRGLLESLARLKQPPRVLIGASAIGIYGSRGDALLDETATSGAGFLADVGRAWEDASLACDIDARRVIARFGIVLSPRAGALSKLLPLFRLGVGGRIGTGDQFMSWISIDDTVSAIATLLLDDRLSGPFNLTAPEPVTNRHFTSTLARVLRRPALLPVPAFLARLSLGQMADEALLASTRAIPAKLVATGFRFRHPRLAEALAHLLGRAPS